MKAMAEQWQEEIPWASNPSGAARQLP